MFGNFRLEICHVIGLSVQAVGMHEPDKFSRERIRDVTMAHSVGLRATMKVNHPYYVARV